MIEQKKIKGRAKMISGEEEVIEEKDRNCKKKEKLAKETLLEGLVRGRDNLSKGFTRLWKADSLTKAAANWSLHEGTKTNTSCNHLSVHCLESPVSFCHGNLNLANGAHKSEERGSCEVRVWCVALYGT